MKKKSRDISQDVTDEFYHGKKSITVDDLNKWNVQPTSQLDVDRISIQETKVSWSFSVLLGNPHLIVTKLNEDKSYQYEKRGLVWFLIANGLIMPIAMAIFLMIAIDATFLELLKVLGIGVLFWWPFIYFMSTVIYKSIIKNVEKQIGRIIEKRASDDKSL